jgi:hypothetical protein
MPVSAPSASANNDKTRGKPSNNGVTTRPCLKIKRIHLNAPHCTCTVTPYACVDNIIVPYNGLCVHYCTVLYRTYRISMF